MGKDKKSIHFVVSHQPIPWQIPFAHTVIGVEGYAPSGGVAAREYMPCHLDDDTSLGGLRALPALISILKGLPKTIEVFRSSYRLFIGSDVNRNWTESSPTGRKVIKASDFKSELISNEIPGDLDVLIPKPISLSCSVLEHYAISHHLDDLLLGLGVAVRCGFVRPEFIPRQINSSSFIPFANFAAQNKIVLPYLERLWDCVLSYMRDAHRPRIGYQRRSIDFVFERIQSIAITQMLADNRLRAGSSESVSIDKEGVYRPTT